MDGQLVEQYALDSPQLSRSSRRTNLRLPSLAFTTTNQDNEGGNFETRLVALDFPPLLVAFYFWNSTVLRYCRVSQGWVYLASPYFV